MEKTKITEIREYYTHRVKERNAQGEEVIVERQTFTYKELEYVTGWTRFGHYILDTICYMIFSFILGVAFGIFLVLSGATFDDENSLDLALRLLGYFVFYPGYYILWEATMGQTPGKAATGAIVVNEYGEKPSFAQIVGRSYARIIPFEAFSCLGVHGWHDQLSHTLLIKKSQLKELKLLQDIQNFDAPAINTVN